MKNYKFLLVIFFLIFSFSDICLAQNRQIIDSLKNVVSNTVNDSIKAKNYAYLSWYYAGTRTKLDTARFYADSIKLLSYNGKDKNRVAMAHFYYGMADRFAGNYHQGIWHTQKAIEYYQEIGDSTKLSGVLYQVASMHQKLGNYSESLVAYQRGIDIYRQDNNTQGVANSLLAMGHIKRTINKNEAIKTYEEAIIRFKELDDKEGISMSLEGIGNAYSEIKDYNKGQEYLFKSLEIAKEDGSSYRVADITENIGTNYSLIGNYQKALKLQKEALNIRNSLPSKRDIAQSLNHVGRAYLKLGNNDLAQDYFLKSLKLSKEINNGLLLRRNYSALIKYYEALNRKDLAFDYQKLFMVIKDSMAGVEKNKQLLEIETKYQTIQKDKEIALLTTENKLKEKEAQRQDDIKKAILAGSLLALLLAGLLIYTLRQKLKNQKIIAAKNEEIKISNLKKELSTLEMKALRAQMNPHFLFNCMNSINTMILRDDNTNASKYLTKFSKLVRLMLENSENPKVTLQDELEMLNAYIALESIRFKGKIDYVLEVNKDIDKETTLIPSMILQPFVENAIWHGLLHTKNKTGKLSIKVYEKNDVLHCSILDNGVGRAAALKLHKKTKLKKKSMGIKITTDRLTLLTKEKIKEVVKIIDLKDDKNNPLGTQVDILIPIS